MPRPLSLRARLLWWLLVPLLLISTAGGGMIYGIASNFSAASFDRHLYDLGRAVRHEICEILPARFSGTVDVGVWVEQLDPYNAVHFAVLSEDGRTVTATNSIPPATSNAMLLDVEKEARIYDGRIGNDKVRIVSLQGCEDGSNFLQILVAQNERGRHLLAEKILSTTIHEILLLIGCVTLAVIYGVSRGLRPLHEFARTVSLRSPSDLAPIEIDHVPLETRQLVASLNGLVHRIKTSADNQNRWLSDASHLLQTPLAGMRAQIELAQRQEVSNETRRVFGFLHLGVKRMSRVVRNLLLLARSDPSVVTCLPLVPVELRRLVVDAVADWVPVALDKGVDLGSNEERRTGVIQGDIERLRSLLDCLIENAIHYTPSGGTVTVGYEVEQTTASLFVRDSGPGISPQERHRVFERFYRVPGTEANGSGLGLAIVKEIAELHGAQIVLRDNPSTNGTEVVIEFSRHDAQQTTGDGSIERRAAAY